jgi:phosphatidylinositol-3-phosphatase
MRIWLRRRWSISILLLVLALPGCASHHGPGPAQATRPPPGSTPPTTTAPAAATGPVARVLVVVEENHAFDQIIGSPEAPFLNQLASRGVLLTAYHAVGHPSLPNYLAMTSGDTHGITSDCTDCTVTGPNLASQLEGAGISWKAYMQGLPAPCSDVARSGSYAKKHDPFMYFDSIRRAPRQCAKVVGFSRLDTDLAAGRLPRFAFIVPDQEHDMHDGPVGVADGWLRDFYGRLVASASWQAGTRLVVTFDEGTDRDNRVATIVAGPGVRAGVDAAASTHYALLRSIQALFGLPYLGHAADPATAAIPALANR